MYQILYMRALAFLQLISLEWQLFRFVKCPKCSCILPPRRAKCKSESERMRESAITETLLLITRVVRFITDFQPEHRPPGYIALCNTYCIMLYTVYYLCDVLRRRRQRRRRNIVHHTLERCTNPTIHPKIFRLQEFSNYSLAQF